MAIACAFAAATALGQFGGGRHGGGSKGHAAGEADHAAELVAPPPPLVALTPHGGQFLTTADNRYELVFMPLQTRIYVYDKEAKPLAARDVRVQMSLQLPGETASRRIPLVFVAVPPEMAEQDYVMAVFDVGQLRDAETPITLEFSNLPDRRHPTASFAPIFTRGKIRPYVAQVALAEADRGKVARQAICPVSGHPLGSNGQVVKLLIGEYPLYLCSEKCIAAVKQAPERYVPHGLHRL
ncbi:MAG: hypothetical protein ABSG68_08755 [Thermoguttaceae bacterium]|jgi:hypothetical protein